MPHPKPSIVLVHGAWHVPKHMEQLEHTLVDCGYKCVLVALPSSQSTDQPPATLADDTETVRFVVMNQLRLNSVVIVAHSYGGCPSNNALTGLDQKSRLRAGYQTYVDKIAFINAIPAPKGVRFLDMVGGKAGPMHDRRKPDFVWVNDPAFYLYNDMEQAEAELWVSLLKPQSWLTAETNTTAAAYMDIPCHYLHCSKDNIFPVEAQRELVARAATAGARIVVTEIIEADHTPFIGRNTGRTAEFVRRAAGEAVAYGGL